MKIEDRLGALAASAIMDSYNSALRRVYQDIYNEQTLVWKTTGKSNVCEDCVVMDKTEFGVNETIGILPFHPGCFCTWISRSELY